MDYEDGTRKLTYRSPKEQDIKITRDENGNLGVDVKSTHNTDAIYQAGLASAEAVRTATQLLADVVTAGPTPTPQPAEIETENQ